MSDTQAIKTQIEEIGKNFESFRALHEKSLKEKDGLIEASIKQATDDIAAKHEKLSNEIEKLATQMNRTNAFTDGDAAMSQKAAKDLARFNQARRDVRSGSQWPEHLQATVSGEELAAYEKAFDRYMRYDYDGAGEIKKTLSVGSDPDGGNWITPPTIMNTIINRIFETSPMRDVATVVPLSTHALRIPQNPNEFNAGWVAEQSPRPSTLTPKVVMREIVAAELYAEPPVSQQLLEDSAINVEEWVGKMAGDKLARVENTAFVSGPGGSVAPRGILTYPAGSGPVEWGTTGRTNKWGEIEQVPSMSATTFTYTGLINLITSIKDDYQAAASFLIKRQSVAAIMTLTDTNGRFIFQPILNGEFNNTPLFGYKMRYAFDMPAVAAGSLPLAFGDFKKGYYIVDRVGISMIRDNVTAKPLILFYMRKRTGGDVVDFDAFKLQVIAAS